LRLVVFLPKIWRAPDLILLILPVPVLLNLLAAERFVFILGINSPLVDQYNNQQI
jgi:hypothetical protein